MKKSTIVLLGMAMINIQAAPAAYADNMNVEYAIMAQPDLSDFYQMMLITGVSHELKAGNSYTVFAPVDTAFNGVDANRECLHTPQCRAKLAKIVRNHIVPGKTQIDNAARYEGGLFTLGRFINIDEPSKDHYTINGNNVVATASFHGGTLYKIDGIIASQQEIASVQGAEVQAVTTITKKTIPYAACGPAGCPDSTTETTTITQMVEEPYSIESPMPLPFR
jgi:uncharacterized surface protein with fasciclin (FAS1) repeats